MLNFIATVIRLCDRVDFGVCRAKVVVWNFIILALIIKQPKLEPMFLHKFRQLLLLCSKVIRRPLAEGPVIMTHRDAVTLTMFWRHTDASITR